MKRPIATALLLAELQATARAFHPPSPIGGIGGICPPSHTAATVADRASASSRIRTSSELGYTNGRHDDGTTRTPLPTTTDPYKLLNLSPATVSSSTLNSDQTIKEAYRKMTRLYHPDAVLTCESTEDERKVANDDFQRINEAYQTLLARRRSMERTVEGQGEFGAQTFVVDFDQQQQSYARSTHQTYSRTGFDFGGGSTRRWPNSRSSRSSQSSRQKTGSSSSSSSWRDELDPSQYAEQRERPITDLFDNAHKSSPIRDLFERTAAEFRRQYGDDGDGVGVAADGVGVAADDDYHYDSFKDGEAATTTTGTASTSSTTRDTRYASAAHYASAAQSNQEPPSTTCKDRSVNELFERSVNDFQRYGRAGTRPSSSSSAHQQSGNAAAAPPSSTRRSRGVSDLFDRSAENFHRSGSGRVGAGGGGGGEYGGASRATNCPRDSSVADLFERSAQKFERYGRAGGNRSRSSAAAEAAAAGGDARPRVRAVTDLFEQSVENYSRNGGRSKKKTEDECYYKTKATAARTTTTTQADDWIRSAFNGGASSSSSSSPSAHDAADTPAAATTTAEHRPSSGGRYAYEFGSATAPSPTAAAVPPPHAASASTSESGRDSDATPTPTTGTQSYASLLREKERALEERIAALRRSEAEAQARYESLANELSPPPTPQKTNPVNNPIRNEAVSRISFGVSVVGGLTP